LAKKAVTVDLENDLFRNGTYGPQRQDIPESNKTPAWYWKNAQYYLTFYNQPIGSLRFDAVATTDANNIPYSDRVLPVQHMVRMMLYYQGRQPNLDYAWLTQDVKDINMQAQWYKGQDVAKFVDHFDGIMRERISQANWSANPISKEATNRYTDMYDKMEVAVLMKPILDQLEQQSGIGFNPLPNAPMPEVPEDIERSLATNFYEESADVATELASGIWFTNGWQDKALKTFKYLIMTANAAMWHKVESGRQTQEIVPSHQLVMDNRFDDDYGKSDEFIGIIEPLTAFQVENRYRKNLSQEQIDDIYEMARDNELYKQYNTVGANINWWTNSPNKQYNTITTVTMFFRTYREASKVKATNQYGNPTLRKPQGTPDEKKFPMQDIGYVVIAGNKYLLDWGYVDNLVESIDDPSKPEFPIKRFRPNSFLGESISEVSRIHRIQDEMDMLDYKIRDMIGKAKGKIYVLHGDKLGEGTTPKELIDDFTDMGFHVTTGTSGIADDPADRKPMVEYIDMTLDPNIHRLMELYQQKQAKMGEILSTSNLSLGQQSEYMGTGQQQTVLSQGQLGIAYLIDGFLDFLVMNMRYAVNQAKNLYSLNDDEDVILNLGDKGIRYLKFTKGMRFEKFLIRLTLNDVIDAKGREYIMQQAQAWSQNSMIDPVSLLKLLSAKTYTSAKDELEFDVQYKRKQDQKAQAANMQAEQAHEEMLRLHDAGIVQLKEDNENWRTQFEAIAKQNLQMLTMLQQLQPPASPLQQNLAQADQQPPQQ